MAIPIVLSAAGAQPQSPAALLQQLLALATAESPGLTANLPGSLIEDISSTDVAGVSLCDSAWVELLNSITPYGANAFLLNDLGQMYGIQPGQDTNTSVYVVFSGTAGYPINPGFIVSDGSHQYAVVDGGVVGTGGTSDPLFCVATVSGAWAVPANTVTTIITSVATGYTLTCTNPLDGTPSPGPQTEEEYRADVLQAGRASATGMASFLKAQILKVPGTQERLVSVTQVNGGGWEIIVGGTGDPYQIAYAIYQGLFDINQLVGSTMTVSGYTKANPGVITTVLNHGLTNGQTATISGSAVTAYNGSGTVTVIDEKNFSIGVNSTSFATYTGGGVVSPNARNQAISIVDYPDTYTVKFVVPPQQSVIVDVTWNTTATNLISDASVQSLGAAGIASYINSIAVGQPINLFELQNAFQLAVATVIPTDLLTRMVFTVEINGIVTAPSVGTGIIAGDPESYFSTTAAAITITRG